ncbi:MAG: cytochrome P450 [Thermoanaerobaculia bacterium]|nr:cytochrome P450 [Thermoanaerobaculia bacterium]
MTKPGEPVEDWATDYDIFDDRYVERPEEIWSDLRQSCPVAHTDRLEGSWLPTRMEDIRAIAKNVTLFSSREVGVVPPLPSEGRQEEYADLPAPPIQVDPPVHTWSRRLILPFFSPQAVAGYEPDTRALCRSLAERLEDRGEADAAADYAQQIPVRVIARLLGVPEEMSDTFTGWVRSLLEFAGKDRERSRAAREEIFAYLHGEMMARMRQEEPGDDVITALLEASKENEEVTQEHILGTCFLLLVAGIDTTWSGIGSSLWHLATHADDRRRLVAEPDLIPTAIEELLRAYSPVTMARIVTEDVEFEGCPMKEGDRVLLAFPAANRDPEAFDNADEVILDRQRNRHVAFGVGIHRCAGSNLARMELRVALEEWLRAIPEFELDTSKPMTWAGGQVRGPRQLPVVFPTRGGESR